MNSEQQSAGRDQAKAEAKAEVRGLLISLELERRRRRLHLGGRLQVPPRRQTLKYAQIAFGPGEPANADVAAFRNLTEALSIVEELRG